jgi:hypothetical protein
MVELIPLPPSKGDNRRAEISPFLDYPRKLVGKIKNIFLQIGILTRTITFKGAIFAACINKTKVLLFKGITNLNQIQFCAIYYTVIFFKI